MWMFCQAWKETNNFLENRFVNKTIDNLVTFSTGRKNGKHSTVNWNLSGQFTKKNEL